MSNIIKFPVIAGVEITTDEEGRFNLNALHRASGLSKAKQPSNWLRLDSTKELIAEILNSSDMRIINTEIPVFASKGKNGGTFAHELLAISYAGWISPAFQLKVNKVFLDYRSGNLEKPQDLATLLISAGEELKLRDEKIAVLEPKAEALQRIAIADGSRCITNTAKDLQARPKDLFSWLAQNKWIYKRPGNITWTAYQARIEQGVLEHKVTIVTRDDGTEKTIEQVLVTGKGLVRLGELGAGQRAAA